MTTLIVLISLLVGFVLGASRERVLSNINKCKHKYQADTQITVIRCKLCGKKHHYEQSVDLYPPK